MRVKQHTGYSLRQDTIAYLKDFCVANDKIASAVVERAILEYLKSQGHFPPNNRGQVIGKGVS
jgi:hypothetical protein